MKLIEVNTTKEIKQFHQVPFLVYKNDPNWIPHLKQDVEKIFTPKENKFYRHGEAIRWILVDSEGKGIGRVAAFINKKLSNSFKQPTGGLGFFECIDDKNAAEMLINKCKKWLEERDMKAMDGPINFGEKDKYWGLVTENFETPPYYCQNYNPEYYVGFFEEYGFKIYYNQYIFYRTVEEPLQEKYQERADRIAQNPKYEIKTIDKKNLAKYAEDFRTIYNRAWLKHDNFKGMPQAQAMAIMKTIKPIMDENLIYFAYYEGNPVGFYISLPEINSYFKYVNGNFNLYGKVKFLYHKMRNSCKTTFGVAFGIDPDHQGKGLEGAIFKKMAEIIPFKTKYEDIVITWIGDFNPKMIRIVENLGGTKIRALATYRYLFDQEALFERAPIIG